jgi:hypothetical protein
MIDGQNQNFKSGDENWFWVSQSEDEIFSLFKPGKSMKISKIYFIFACADAAAAAECD